jgi:large subunit ribosomal protein L19
MNKVIHEIERLSMRPEIPEFAVGDNVDVHVKIVEGDKERIQVFNGDVIARRGSGTREAFTVRRIVQGEGVERTFPLHSPKLIRIEVKKHSQKRIRRAKLYYMRKRVGREARVR